MEYHPGDRVMIYNQNGRGETIREGYATICKITGLDPFHPVVDGCAIFNADVEFEDDDYANHPDVYSYSRTLWPEAMAEAQIREQDEREARRDGDEIRQMMREADAVSR